jgi:hypothetical protein
MLRITLRASRRLAAILVAVHVAAGVTCIPLDIPLEIKLAISAAIAVSLVHALRRYALLRGRAALVALELRAERQADAQTRDGAWHHACILGTSYVSASLTVLNLKFDDRLVARHLIIVPDMLDIEDFRALRVILRWGGTPPAARARKATPAR